MTSEQANNIKKQNDFWTGKQHKKNKMFQGSQIWSGGEMTSEQANNIKKRKGFKGARVNKYVLIILFSIFGGLVHDYTSRENGTSGEYRNTGMLDDDDYPWC